MFGLGLFGKYEFAVEDKSIVLSSNLALPGLGMNMFGQPFWLDIYNTVPKLTTLNITGNAMVINPNVLTGHYTRNVTGHAIVVRKAYSNNPSYITVV
jgi:hypothetical protein